MRPIAISLLMVLLAASAAAQAPVPVSRKALSQHLQKRVPVEEPVAAKAAHLHGMAVLLVQVNEAGRVVHTQAISGPALLVVEARKSVREWRYRPFRKDGQAVAVQGLVRVEFQGRRKPNRAEVFLEKVRQRYANEPGLSREGFSCRVEPEWGDFPAMRHVPGGSPLWKRMRRTRVKLQVAKAGAPLTEIKMPKKPRLDVQQTAEANRLVTAVRRMVDGFYMTWLPFGIEGPSAPGNAKLKKAGNKWVIEYRQGDITDWMSFDKERRMLHFTELMPDGAAVEESPQFSAGPDGLLYTGTDFVIHQDGRNTHGSYQVQYQKVGGYQMPKVVSVRVSQGHAVRFRFRDCKAGKD